MEELTYDPVLDSQPVPRWRLTNPLRPPAPGRALVLVPDSGAALTVRPGEEIPAARFGAYQRVYTVDLTEHRLVLDIALLSSDATFAFRGRVELVCRVADPAEVVARGIRDMSGALYGPIRRMLRQVSRDYDVAEFHEAEEALNAAVRGFAGDSAVRLRGIQIELLVDEDEIATSGREFRDVVRETRLDGMRRRRHLDLLRDEGVEGIIAEIMEREGPHAALAWIEKGEAEKREARLAAMRMVLERGDAHREPFEQAELERAVVEDILGDGGGPFGGGRRSRVRGALSAGGDFAEPKTSPRFESEEPSGRAALRGEVVPPRDASRSSEDVSRRSAAASRPPEDEPVPAPGADTPPARSRLSEPKRPGPGREEPRHRGPESAGPEPSEPRRVSRVRGTAKRPGGAGGTSGTDRDGGERR
ncbi:hypothetical protein GCM10011579_051370 [Streptomyces albiflavescens]|uniref:Band 7 domain-containing protein n=1 Tax=Streptomyces albiflavescens TaxID=1623582 RepID=A0A917Y7F5_9ACTN|nr:hypothetical protein [Streptomyces albiflavescens]GGN73323.1 hypothetical protein GCM10011579_051370 [Streptomyces albiflavescens]